MRPLTQRGTKLALVASSLCALLLGGWVGAQDAAGEKPEAALPGELRAALARAAPSVVRVELVQGERLPEAVRWSATHAADALGRADLGRLAPGAWADLVVLDEHLEVEAVYRAGVEVAR